MSDTWSRGGAYDAYVGRWSRRVAQSFLNWLDQPEGLRWLDVGCGTGALTASILARANPAEVTGVDQSAGFLSHAGGMIDDPRAIFRLGDARDLPVPDHDFDVAVCGLAINFVPNPVLAAAEVARVVKHGGVGAAYVWDYAEGMQMMRYFWDAAVAVDPGAAAMDEAFRFPICRPGPLRELWERAGFQAVGVETIEVTTEFRDFGDFWAPFLEGQGTAPGYLMSLPENHRNAVREMLRKRLPQGQDGSIKLTARAWAVRGEVP